MIIAHMMPYGVERDDQRNMVLMSDTGPIPIEILPHALQMARQLKEDSYPPTCADIIRAAVKIEHETDPEKYRRSGTGYMRSPEWYRQLKRGRVIRRQTSGW